MARLIVVANRLPISITKQDGQFHLHQSPGGLAVGLSSLPDSLRRIWIGWPGITSGQLNKEDHKRIREELADKNCIGVLLSGRQIDQYYLGFSNKTIWPLFHYFPERTAYEPRYWQSYVQVNEVFCQAVLDTVEPGDSVWVHDFQLMLLPKMLRERMPDLEIGFFLHIPWPSFEIFRLLPWRREILEGLLGADLIGFHSYDYVRHFLSSVSRLSGVEHTLGELSFDNRVIKVDAFPMGIDYTKYAEAKQQPHVGEQIDKIIRTVGGRKTILSVDRLDYTKGIIERLEAFDLFLSENRGYVGQVTLIIVAVPSRTGVEDYQLLRQRLEQLVGRINGEYSSLGYMPVWYLYRHLPFHELTALYNVADVALVTPLRDGMNLIAKEFVATKTDGLGVLILGEMTGASSELGEALIVNANDKRAIAEAIKEALEMPPAEQAERNKLMQDRLRRYGVQRWSLDFVNTLSDIKKKQRELSVRKLSVAGRDKIRQAYATSRRRLLLLDYDGTLVGFKGRPAQAGPDEDILAVLSRLSSDPKNEVVIISGRDKTTLSDWLGKLNVALVAEHGGWTRLPGGDWQSAEPVTAQWKDPIRPILELFSDRTPGSLVEEKDFSLVWHYRRAEPEQAYVRTHELRDALVHLTENLDVGVFEGSKILEIRKLGISKGHAAKSWTDAQDWDFLLAVGDDYTDEEMFAAMPGQAYSIRVGASISRARFNVDTVQDVRSLLKELARSENAET